MGPDSQKFDKKTIKSPHFEWEKFLDMGKGFRPQAAHPVQK